MHISYGITLVIILVASAVAIGHLQKIHRFDEIIVTTGRQQALDPRLLSALIWKESRFDPACRGSRGEIGLMQLTSGAAQDWAEESGRTPPNKQMLFNPQTNILVGSWYLARAVRRWSEKSDPIPYALAEYNAGRSNALRWAAQPHATPQEFLDSITYPTTRKYVSDILFRYRGGL